MNKLLSAKDKLFIEVDKISNSTISSTHQVMDELLSKKQEHLFADFEDHMNNSGGNVDFRNVYIDELVNSYLSK